MARGITETDVWQAADALLLAGQRPTIERVRQQIGRGSPNTVAPHLETWFRHLGGRIQDPKAFSAPPALPDPIQQAAQHFWEVALSLGRQVCAAEVETARTECERLIAAATDAQTQAERQADQARQRLEEISAQLDARSAALDQERQEHAAARARLAALQRQIDQLEMQSQEQQVRATAELATLREDTRLTVAQTEERAQAAERRAALDMDRERQARLRAEKRAEQLEDRLERQQAQFQAESLQTVEQSVRQTAELQAARDQLRAQAERIHQLTQDLGTERATTQSQIEQRQQLEISLAATTQELALLRKPAIIASGATARPLRKSLRGSAQRRLR